MTDRAGYHHGDLRNALLQATRELISERGTRGFSVSEAARRANVSASAPYRHFADRDAMLAAVARSSFVALREAFDDVVLVAELPERAAQIVRAYVAFARADSARFDAMFAAGIDKSEHPELLEEAARVQDELEKALSPYISPDQVTRRAAELWTLAHGIAALATSGNLGHVVPEGQQGALATSAAHAWASGVLAAQL